MLSEELIIESREQADRFLRYLWAYHRVADRAGQRRSEECSRVLATLAAYPVERGTVPSYRVGASNANMLGLSDTALWLSKDKLFTIAKEYVGSPDRNLLNPQKNLVKKLRAFTQSPVFKELQSGAIGFDAVFAEDVNDVVLLAQLFHCAPSALTWRGPVLLGWDHPEGIVWFGTTADASLWAKRPTVRAAALAHPLRACVGQLSPWTGGILHPALEQRPYSSPWALAVLRGLHYAKSTAEPGVLRADDGILWRLAAAESLADIQATINELSPEPTVLVLATDLHPETFASELYDFIATEGRDVETILPPVAEIRRIATMWPWLWRRPPAEVTWSLPSTDDVVFASFIEVWRVLAPHVRRIVIRDCWSDLRGATDFDERVTSLIRSEVLPAEFSAATQLALPSFLDVLLPFVIGDYRSGYRRHELPTLTQLVRETRDWIIEHANRLRDEAKETLFRVARHYDFGTAENNGTTDWRVKHRAYMKAWELLPGDPDVRLFAGLSMLARTDAHEGIRLVNEVANERPELRFRATHDALMAVLTRDPDTICFVVEASLAESASLVKFARRYIEAYRSTSAPVVVATAFRAFPAAMVRLLRSAFDESVLPLLDATRSLLSLTERDTFDQLLQESARPPSGRTHGVTDAGDP
jgi:hypothetical protein